VGQSELALHRSICAPPGSVLVAAIEITDYPLALFYFGRAYNCGTLPRCQTRSHGALGYVWRLATYFVMPLLALENIKPGEAFYRSAALLKRKWGEVIVAGFSFPLLFVVLAVPGVALIFFLAGSLGQSFGFAAILAIIYWLLLAVIVFTTEQVFCVALYRYATEDRVSSGFSRTDLASAWEGLAALPAGQAL
jgi:Family of unknown function (DUF6159)